MRLQLSIIFLLLFSQTFAQTDINVGVGYYGENLTSPGVVLEFEFEKFHSEYLSLPTRADLGFFIAPDYNAYTLDFHQGFRQYFKSGLFVEQFIGLGFIATTYNLESIWYIDDYGNPIRYKDGLNIGFMPSVTVGVGYNLSENGGNKNLIWIRPKVYWNFLIRGLNTPYWALQVGYTHTLKTK